MTELRRAFSEPQDPLIAEAEKIKAKEGKAIAELLGRPLSSVGDVTFRINTQDEGIASASGAAITLHKRYFDKNREDLPGVTVHELTHAIQRAANYSGDFVWMVEGIADFVRHKLGYGTVQAGDPRKSYKVAAGFINWLYERPDNKQTYKAFIRDVTAGVMPVKLNALLAEYNNGEPKILPARKSLPKPHRGPQA